MDKLSIREFLDGNQLKLIAVISMLVDHIGYLLVGVGMVMSLSAAGQAYGNWWILYQILRCIGRAAFPIYAFLLVEGFFHTRDRKKYALRLGAFAMISEIPYDLLGKQTFFDWKMQNVFFTLLIGLIMLGLLERVNQKVADQNIKMEYMLVVQLAVIAGACGLAWMMRTDYDYIGVMLIALFWWFRADRERACLMGFVWMVLMMRHLTYLPGYAVGFLLIYLYSGQCGRQRGKYVYYLFYPLHMILLYFVYKLIFNV